MSATSTRTTMKPSAAEANVSQRSSLAVARLRLALMLLLVLPWLPRAQAQPASSLRSPDPSSVLLYTQAGITRAALLWPDAFDAPTSQQPTLIGLATWYGDAYHIGRETRSGDPFDPSALTCAVPDELWPILAGRLLRIEQVANDRSVTVRVNDSGFLTQAGQYTWDVRRVGELDVARWWPTKEGLSIVVDLTQAAQRLLDPDLETVEVHVFLIPE